MKINTNTPKKTKTTNIQDGTHCTALIKNSECKQKVIVFPIILTCGGPYGGGNSGAHGWDAVIVLGVAGLNGSQVAVTPGSEATGQVQGVHGLGLHLTEHRLAHGLKLAVNFCFAHLRQTK